MLYFGGGQTRRNDVSLARLISLYTHFIRKISYALFRLSICYDCSSHGCIIHYPQRVEDDDGYPFFFSYPGQRRGLAEIGRYCVILVQPFLLHINRRLYAYSSESPRFKHSLCAGFFLNKLPLFTQRGKGTSLFSELGKVKVLRKRSGTGSLTATAPPPHSVWLRAILNLFIRQNISTSKLASTLL